MGSLEEHPFGPFNQFVRSQPRLVKTSEQLEAGWIVFFCMVGAALIVAVAVGVAAIRGGS